MKDSRRQACSAIAAMLAVAAADGTADAAATLDRAPYGTTQDGQTVEIYTMTNDHDLRVRFLSYGGIITEIQVPDRTGRLDNIVLGLRTLKDYETLPGHFGAITGRYANRIGGAQFTLNDQTYRLIANNGPNTLHGGPNALDRRVWTVTPLTVPDGAAAMLSYVSPDGDQNFPGTLTTRVTYTLTNDNVLQISYVASTDKDTVINFTNHSYFNLAGNGSGSVAGQMLLVNADRYTLTGPDQIPTGEMAPVEGTPIDFRQMLPIGARLASAFEQMVYARGYDHNFVLNKPSGGVTFAARAYDPRTGRVLDCFTTEPGVQIYTSNGLNGSIVGSSGTTYRQTEGFTLETQHFPDSPNKPNFPTTELKAGQQFRSTTIFRFATDAPLPPLPH
ncbi:MAG: galactose mutarotase [Alphaproteobacteria bacterium]|nr:galactose mutarotase [Alphaproteobacteria bacterium]MBV9375320.1 galactose mutarotase [Alphaproteobacteria bacterium]